jgi:hypothetical protein
MEFTQELLDRTQRYFAVRFGLEITYETAEEYLGQFAELYSSMASFVGSGGGLAVAEPRASEGGEGSGAPAPDLITPHS